MTSIYDLENRIKQLENENLKQSDVNIMLINLIEKQAKQHDNLIKVVKDLAVALKLE